MKLKLLFALSICIFMSLSLPSHALAGKEGGGGDDVGLQFAAAYNTAIFNLKKLLPNLAATLPMDTIIRQKAKVHVYVVDEPIRVEVGGKAQFSVARNYPGLDRIEVNRSRWSAIQNSYEREGIALHELLSLLHLEETGVYQYSGAYVSLFRDSSQIPSQPNPGGPVPQIQIVAIDNASSFTSVGPLPTLGQIAIFGGTAGTTTNCRPNSNVNDRTCNNCTNTTGLADCNDRRILPGAPLKISFKTPVNAGFPVLEYVNPSSGIATTIGGLTRKRIGKNGVATVEALWSQICPYLSDNNGTNSGADCMSPTPVTGVFRVGLLGDGDSSLSGRNSSYQNVTIVAAGSQADGITNSNELTLANGEISHTAYPCSATEAAIGICGFSIFPGSKQASIRDAVGRNGFPLATALDFAGVRLFYSDKSFDDLNSTSPHHDIWVSGGAGQSPILKNPTVKGLQTGKTYYFRVGSIDLAGNISFFTDARDDNDCEYTTPPLPKYDCHIAHMK